MGNKYQYLTPEEREILEAEPAISETELAAINELFDHYIIYTREKNGMRISTSCCHRREELVENIQRTETPALRELLTARHGDYIRCPFCGRYATLRAKGKTTGARWEHIDGRAVLLHTMENGELYARAVWLRLDIRDLPWAPPRVGVASIYHFAPGCVRQFWKSWDGVWYCDTEAGALHGKKKVEEPFLNAGFYSTHEQYAVIGCPEELDKSFLRWTDYRLWRRQDAPDKELHDDLIRFLTVGSVYPRQLEMLNKAGQRTLINDLIWEGKKNAKIFRWEETDPRRAFGLSGQELREYLNRGDSLCILRAKKALGCSLEYAAGLFDGIQTGFSTQWEFERFLKLCKKYSTQPEATRKYLSRFTGPRCNGGIFGLASAMRYWDDYLTNAAAAGMDVRLPNILMPRDLFAAHNNAMEIVQAQRAVKNAEELAARNARVAERRATLDRLYGFETEHYLIRAPRDAEEIIAEGNALRHCVAGYAQRHADGKSTILFLRDKARPEEPLCTIEVDRFRLVQIHGYRNDAEKDAVKPALRFAEIYEPWTRWLDAKCPRKKDGIPRVPRQKKEAKTA